MKFCRRFFPTSPNKKKTKYGDFIVLIHWNFLKELDAFFSHFPKTKNPTREKMLIFIPLWNGEKIYSKNKSNAFSAWLSLNKIDMWTELTNGGERGWTKTQTPPKDLSRAYIYSAYKI